MPQALNSIQIVLSADEEGAGVVLLQRNSAAAAMPDSEPDEGDEGLAKLLTPGRMPDSASTAKFTQQALL